ncbi:crotonobetainyl-CoA:carnitine CoA-transferase CaiB-like acyl-CoA transferase [Cupriavidus gilardii J11]|uniref:Crotonobetainyl-CoA:carnitine CoA-transferase CaiB-like acyl-CoA transferase n=1 Tax=Cupriavidus gilardii J11 TaxID=936133 RepID=A0A562BK37_9BURK|nr:CoA transferase [Cupriavidus gilardii]TWG85618.1 crotonobetainyl-CoA:carnitine CoA-transferase CaiB-like acyl-CoA transferase [Cupriavidus gilardii J11]
MAGALEGIRVIDITTFVLGPVATQMLGDMGADVIKVEAPEGDPTRDIGQRRSPGMGSFFLNLNRNKRSVVLDLKQPAGRASLQALIAGADVVVHNMRSGAAARLGIDYASLCAGNPRLVHATAQGFGRGGRYFDRPAYDDVIQGLSGVPGLNRRMTGQPGYIPMLLADKLCGVYLYSAIMTALVARERTGQGQEVQLPMFEAMAAFNLLEHMADHVFVPPPGQPAAPLGYGRVFSAVHRPLMTRDEPLCIIANTDAQWHRVFELIGRGDLRNDDRFATIGRRMENVVTLYDLVEAALKRKTRAEWLEAFAAADVPAGPANELADIRDDAHMADVDFFQVFDHESEGALLMPRNAMQLSATPAAIHRGPPRLGQHTDEVLAEQGSLRGGSGECR